MCKRYLQSHVFVCPSFIENSPNSVGEAQLLGIPCIASFVGGVSDMVVDGETGLLYRFEEVEMLAAAVCRIFTDDKFAKRLSVDLIGASREISCFAIEIALLTSLVVRESALAIITES